MQNEIWKENFKLLQEFDLSFDLQLYPEQMLEAAEFLAKHPKTQIIIDHAGSPYDPSMAGLEKWKEGMAHLSTLPNVSAKISGLGMFDLHANAKREAGVYINWILEKFGRSRTLYGSNFPVDKLMSTYDDTIETIVKHLPAGGAGEALSHSIFFENAKRIYKL